MTQLQPIAVLVFGLIVIVIESYILLKRQQGVGSSTIRIFGVTLVLTIAMFLAVSSQAQDRFGQSLGFLGTIAGYLLGKSDSQPGS
jgi:hypothetical protein